jgi:hypothetical protein
MSDIWTVEAISVQDGKIHRTAEKTMTREGWDHTRRVACGRTLKPYNVFETEADARRHCGNRRQYLCKQCGF